MKLLSKDTLQRHYKIYKGLSDYIKIEMKRLFLGDNYLLSSTKYGIYVSILRFSTKRYLKVRKEMEQRALNKIKNQAKIKIAFVVYTSSMWFFDELYHLMEKNERFDPAIIIGHKSMNDENSTKMEYEKSKRFFVNKEYRISDIDELESFQVLFYLTPYSFYEEELDIKNIKLSQLIFHASYSYMLGGNMAKLSLEMYHWSIRYYTDSQYYLDRVAQLPQYCENARYLGYPKMDQFYQAAGERLSDKITIIYAPHHSVNYTEFKSATFEYNYRFMLELIKKYKDRVYWIYKPHPLLRANSIEAHIFKNYQEYDAYVEELYATGCVKISDGGDYFDFFKASDAMITDSVSFLAEYQFTKKPLLLLKSGKGQYNEFGQSIVDILYSCDGKDYHAIESFVKNVINDKDPMAELRRDFFDKNLDYGRLTGSSANKRIYNDMLKLLQ